MRNDTTIINWALAYHKAGWPIFPCLDKRPLTQLLGPWSGSWTRIRDEGVTEDVIRDWWLKVPQAQIGMACGKKSRITVVDIDRLKDTEIKGVLHDQGEDPGELAKRWPTPIVSTTGNKGRHLFFRNADVPNSAKTVHPQIDIRSEGGYVILPPSVHANGRTYEWDAQFPWSYEKLQSLPEFPIDLVQTAVKTPAQTKGWVSIAQGATQGSRNNSAAGLAGKLIRAHDQHTAWELLSAWNAQKNRPPMSEQELLSTFLSIIKIHYAKRARRH